MKIRKIRPDPLLVILFILVYSFICLFYGSLQTPNWDERASIDIALGIRPSFGINKAGWITPDLQYEKVLDTNIFRSNVYERYNHLEGVFNAVMRDNSNSFVYYVILHVLLKLTGISLFWMRLLSVMLTALNLWILYKLSLRFFAHTVYSWMLLMLIACNPVFFDHSYDIRTYMLALFFCLASTYLLIEITESQKQITHKFILYFAATALALFSHYYTLAVIAGQFTYLVFFIIKKEHREVKFLPLTVTGIIAVICIFAAWLFVSMPVGIRNLNLLNDAIKAGSLGTAYETTPENYARQMLTVFTYLLGLNGDIIQSTKLIMKLMSIGILFIVLSGMITTYKYDLYKKKLIIIPVVLSVSIIIFSLQSFIGGYLTVFLPHYLIFIFPFFIFYLMSILSSLNKHKKFISIHATVCLLLCVNLFLFGYRMAKIPHQVETNKNCLAGLKTNTIHCFNVLTFSQITKQFSSTLSENDTLVYNNWQVAHQMNYFLRKREDIVQKVILPSPGQYPMLEIRRVNERKIVTFVP